MGTGKFICREADEVKRDTGDVFRSKVISLKKTKKNNIIVGCIYLINYLVW